MSTNQEIPVPEKVIQAILDQERVDNPPHNFYAYPARFSPTFAKAFIAAYTDRGDTVLDPFCGGGTTIVEAISQGRRAAGADISSLAVFLSRTKTSPLTLHDKKELAKWLGILASERAQKPYKKFGEFGTNARQYSRNLPGRARRFFGYVLNSLETLKTERQRDFARLALLSVGQRALDCKERRLRTENLMDQLLRITNSMMSEYFKFVSGAAEESGLPRVRISSMRRIINKSSEFLHSEGRIPQKWLPAKLVLTSPPYPGVHVIYHRWQVNGRRETATPFWLANSRDGSGESYYTLGSRKEVTLKTYFTRLGQTFSAVRTLVNKDSIVAQLVAFSEPEWQLPLYLSTMESAGFGEARPVCDEKYLHGNRIWRNVPGRKWYAKNKPTIHAGNEVLLLHRPV